MTWQDFEELAGVLIYMAVGALILSGVVWLFGEQWARFFALSFLATIAVVFVGALLVGLLRWMMRILRWIARHKR